MPIFGIHLNTKNQNSGKNPLGDTKIKFFEEVCHFGGTISYPTGLKNAHFYFLLFLFYHNTHTIKIIN